MVQGWRVVLKNMDQDAEQEKSVLPEFVKGEKGIHLPSFMEKETKPPNQYSEASLLRSMESAGKEVEDEELSDMMKENGIGRPSTRASIIETLFRRNYIMRNKKQILPTATGIDLIETIQNNLLKSPELTGKWEKKLKEIERGDFNAGSFIRQMKQMVDQLVYEVRSENSGRTISSAGASAVTKAAPQGKKDQLVEGTLCPKCRKGKLLKGTRAFGCNRYGNGCDFLLPFQFMGKKVSENQYLRLLGKGETVTLKGFVQNGSKTNGKLQLDEKHSLVLKESTSKTKLSARVEKICPKCAKGKILKGRRAYGCSNFNKGCDFLFPFSKLTALARGQKLTEKLVHELISAHGS